MEKYAIIQLDGRQYKITEGLEIRSNRQDELDFQVLLYSDGKTVEFGNPVLSDVSVKAKVVRNIKAPKIVIGRFKSKSRYQKTKGHRQPLSVIKIETISKTSKKSTKVKSTKSGKK